MKSVRNIYLNDIEKKTDEFYKFEKRKVKDSKVSIVKKIITIEFK